jgi:hypothetical protein
MEHARASRNTASTIRSVAASAPGARRNFSPEFSTISIFSLTSRPPLVSTNANRTAFAGGANCFRQK